MARSLAFPTLILAVAIPIGCGKIEGLDDLQVVDCPTGCDGGSPDAFVDASVDARRSDALAADAPGDDSAADVSDAANAVDAPVVCTGTAGPTQVNLGSFCIDSTEVTNAQYAAFLTAAGTDKSRLPAACSFKTAFTPQQLWPSSKADNPVVWVDWCDAYAYCAWAGKRLCGAIGGGPSARASTADPNVDEWYAACSARGAKVYPYGQTYTKGTCNDFEINPSGVNATRAVGTMSGCVGGYPGIFDMTGNVWEWEDGCDVSAGQSDACLIRGGSWLFSGQDYGACGVYFNDTVVKRSDAYNDTGFRCCSH